MTNDPGRLWLATNVYPGSGCRQALTTDITLAAAGDISVKSAWDSAGGDLSARPSLTGSATRITTAGFNVSVGF